MELAGNKRTTQLLDATARTFLEQRSVSPTAVDTDITVVLQQTPGTGTVRYQVVLRRTATGYLVQSVTRL
jgi:hypothetical protein